MPEGGRRGRFLAFDLNPQARMPCSRQSVGKRQPGDLGFGQSRAVPVPRRFSGGANGTPALSYPSALRAHSLDRSRGAPRGTRRRRIPRLVSVPRRRSDERKMQAAGNINVAATCNAMTRVHTPPNRKPPPPAVDCRSRATSPRLVTFSAGTTLMMAALRIVSAAGIDHGGRREAVAHPERKRPSSVGLHHREERP